MAIAEIRKKDEHKDFLKFSILVPVVDFNVRKRD